MHRFCAIILVVIFSQSVLCSLIPVMKDVTKADEAQNVVLPLEVMKSDNVSCVPLREPCTFHEDCCSKACLGFMRWCVTGRELDISET
ncbi:unnamed protein product [Arctia plantaginis]|uniref:Uncharacterized protein n=1 Tax=Arctia plantaginis TaxID=874455 RepID=A0A8S0ZTU8_ARCPL|nr:unnamed protein product [Arctia plantaginis]